MLIHPWTTVEPSGPVWPLYQGTGATDQANLAKLGLGQLNLMSLHSALVWHLPITEHKIDRPGVCSLEQSIRWASDIMMMMIMIHHVLFPELYFYTLDPAQLPPQTSTPVIIFLDK